jgi:hypothetical protein
MMKNRKIGWLIMGIIAVNLVIVPGVPAESNLGYNFLLELGSKYLAVGDPEAAARYFIKAHLVCPDGQEAIQKLRSLGIIKDYDQRMQQSEIPPARSRQLAARTQELSRDRAAKQQMISDIDRVRQSPSPEDSKFHRALASFDETIEKFRDFAEEYTNSLIKVNLSAAQPQAPKVQVEQKKKGCSEATRHCIKYQVEKMKYERLLRENKRLQEELEAVELEAGDAAELMKMSRSNKDLIVENQLLQSQLSLFRQQVSDYESLDSVQENLVLKEKIEYLETKLSDLGQAQLEAKQSELARLEGEKTALLAEREQLQEALSQPASAEGHSTLIEMKEENRLLATRNVYLNEELQSIKNQIKELTKSGGEDTSIHAKYIELQEERRAIMVKNEQLKNELEETVRELEDLRSQKSELIPVLTKLKNYMSQSESLEEEIDKLKVANETLKNENDDLKEKLKNALSLYLDLLGHSHQVR